MFGKQVNRGRNDVSKDRERPEESRTLHRIVLGSFCSLLLMLLVGIIIFFAFIKPKDDAMTPKVVGMNLLDAIMALQNNDLEAHIITHFSAKPEDRGMVLDQSPPAGSYIKVGKKINLIVSRGVAVNTVEDFVGKTLDEARKKLVMVYGADLLTVKEPVIYVYDKSPAGRIISQSPSAGAELTGARDIQFIVSRGAIDTQTSITDYVGLPSDQALEALAAANLPFTFILSSRRTDISLTLDQTPASGPIADYKTPIKITISRPNNLQGKLFGLFSFAIPDSPAPVDVSFVVKRDGDDDIVLFSTRQTGVTLTAPYLVEPGSFMSVMVGDVEVMKTSLK